jgi:hypothetical protein
MQFADIKKDDDGLESAYTEADKHAWTQADLDAYEYARLRETDDKAEKMLVVEKAEQRRNIEIAKNMITEGFDNQTIARLTGLNPDQIEQLRLEKQ